MSEAGPMGTEVPVMWRGRWVHAFVPTLLSERDLALSTATVARTVTARAEIVRAAEGLESDDEPLVRLSLRAEGIASSYIEGVRSPVVDVVLAEENLMLGDRAAAWTAANLVAITQAVAASRSTALTIEILCDWHRTLMTGSPTPERYVGVLRDELGWIGGTDPTDAHLVTPPPGELHRLLEDLIDYVNCDDGDEIAQAGISHAQFEIIHPFADGNGRIGRVLVAWILARRLSLAVSPPVSVAIASDVGGYLSGLAMFRLGQHEQWVRWFAGVVESGGRGQRALISKVEELKVSWNARMHVEHRRALRSDAAAWRVLELLPRHLVLTTQIVRNELRLSNKAANDALRQCAERGVLLAYGTVIRGRSRPSKLYVSRELLALVGSNPLRAFTDEAR